MAKVSDLVGTGDAVGSLEAGRLAQMEREMRAKVNREVNGLLWMALWIGSSLGALLFSAIWLAFGDSCSAF